VRPKRSRSTAPPSSTGLSSICRQERSATKPRFARSSAMPCLTPAEGPRRPRTSWRRLIDWPNRRSIASQTGGRVSHMPKKSPKRVAASPAFLDSSKSGAKVGGRAQGQLGWSSSVALRLGGNSACGDGRGRFRRRRKSTRVGRRRQDHPESARWRTLGRSCR